MTESLRPRAGDMKDRSLVGELGSHVLQSSRTLAEQLESMQMCLRSPKLWSPHHSQRGARTARRLYSRRYVQQRHRHFHSSEKQASKQRL